MSLTEKQKRFCEEYLIDLNATQAAIRAGYSAKTADRIASQNLRKLEVEQYLQRLMKQRSQRTGITADVVLEELSKIALSDVEISGKEKMKALELLGKHLGLFANAGSDDTKILEKLKAMLGGVESVID